MSQTIGHVGEQKIEWKNPPHGMAGETSVKVQGVETPVKWSRDAQGVILELPEGIFGFDLVAHRDDDGRLVFRVRQRCTDRWWDELAFVRPGEGAAAGGEAKKKNARLRAQMPGKIIKVLVEPGAIVTKGQPLAVMEAMKMENELVAPQAGRIGRVLVNIGQTVESGADLLLIEAE